MPVSKTLTFAAVILSVSTTVAFARGGPDPADRAAQSKRSEAHQQKAKPPKQSESTPVSKNQLSTTSKSEKHEKPQRDR